MKSIELNTYSIIEMSRNKRFTIGQHRLVEDVCFIASGDYHPDGLHFVINKLIGVEAKVVFYPSVRIETKSLLDEVSKTEFIHLAIFVLLLKKIGIYKGIKIKDVNKILERLRS